MPYPTSRLGPIYLNFETDTLKGYIYIYIYRTTHMVPNIFARNINLIA